MAAKNHEVFLAPKNPDIPIWRYMDFTKFVSMLVHKGLYFSRLDKLGDPFEGSLPKLNVADQSIIVPDELKANPILAQGYIDSFKNMRQAIKRLRTSVFASTWHMAEHESAAMWKLYARTEEAICVRSTYAKLESLLGDDVFVGRVIYIDYDQYMIPLGNILWPYVHKRKSFEHEQELRALIPDLKNGFSNEAIQQPPGIWRDIDLNALIDHIYIAPTAPEWFVHTVQETLKQFGHAFPVVRSALDENPLW